MTMHRFLRFFVLTAIVGSTTMVHSRTSNLEPRTSNLEPRTSNLEPDESNASEQNDNLKVTASEVLASLNGSVEDILRAARIQVRREQNGTIIVDWNGDSVRESFRLNRTLYHISFPIDIEFYASDCAHEFYSTNCRANMEGVMEVLKRTPVRSANGANQRRENFVELLQETQGAEVWLNFSLSHPNSRDLDLIRSYGRPLPHPQMTCNRELPQFSGRQVLPFVSAAGSDDEAVNPHTGNQQRAAVESPSFSLRRSGAGSTYLFDFSLLPASENEGEENRDANFPIAEEGVWVVGGSGVRSCYLKSRTPGLSLNNLDSLAQIVPRPVRSAALTVRDVESSAKVFAGPQGFFERLYSPYIDNDLGDEAPEVDWRLRFLFQTRILNYEDAMLLQSSEDSSSNVTVGASQNASQIVKLRVGARVVIHFAARIQNEDL